MICGWVRECVGREASRTDITSKRDTGCTQTATWSSLVIWLRVVLTACRASPPSVCVELSSKAIIGAGLADGTSDCLLDKFKTSSNAPWLSSVIPALKIN